MIDGRNLLPRPLDSMVREKKSPQEAFWAFLRALFLAFLLISLYLHW
jgi:hypothetical protein